MTSADGIKTVKGDLTLDDNSSYSFQYSGPIPVYNNSGEGKMSSLTADTNVSDLKIAIAYFYSSKTDSLGYFEILLTGPDSDFDNLIYDSPYLQLRLAVDTGSKAAIPYGTYALVNPKDAAAGNAIAGSIEKGSIDNSDTWYFCDSDHTEAAMQTGTVNVTANAGGSYTITFDMADGYTVSGAYTGAIPINDFSEY